MSKRRFSAPTEETAQHRDGLPLKQKVGLYYRQSSEGQIGNVSTTIQTVDMHQNLQRMGWSPGNIILIDVDAAVSGRLRIDQREGMRELFGLIIDRKVGAVAAQDEDRFFRDETMIQVDTFIEACKQSDVRVITPTVVYDFAHPKMGLFYARQFRFKCEMGAEYINTQILGKLSGARKFLMRTGKWAGNQIPVGYMADTRKELRPGEPNPQHRCIVPFEPFAQVVREYYHIFVATGGSVAKTQLRIIRERVFFPDPNITRPTLGFKTHTHLKYRDGGYYPSRSGLRGILMNPVYIGHWMVGDVVERWHNHKPIVEEELFWKAFNYLSPVLPDGSTNLDYRPVKQNARPTVEEKRGKGRPLCLGFIYGEFQGETYPLKAAWNNRWKAYHYYLAPPKLEHGTAVNVWQRRADLIDAAVAHHLRRRFELTFSPEHWEDTLARLQRPEESKERKLKEFQLEDVKRQMELTLRKLDLAEDEPDFIERLQTQYRHQKAERARLEAELQQKRTSQVSVEDLIQLHDNWQELFDVGFRKSSRDEQHLFFQKYIKRVTLLNPEAKSISLLKVVWFDDCEQEIIVPRTSNRGSTFTYAELEQFREMVMNGATKREMLHAFPTHPKNSVYDWHKRLNVTFGAGSHASSPRAAGASAITPGSR